METKKILDSVFEGNNLTTVIWKGKICWLASEISIALGYKKPWRVSGSIRREWESEFIEGEDFELVSGGDVHGLSTRELRVENRISTRELRVEKRVVKNRSMMLLTEPGIDLVILKTRKKAGARLRRHLSSVVLPQLRRGMIKERPARELKAAYRKEMDKLKDKLIERDEQVICFAEKLSRVQEELSHANYQLGSMGQSKASVCRAASLAGKALQIHKGTKKLRDMN